MNIAYQILQVFLSVWWLWLPIILVKVFMELWAGYLEARSLGKINWLLLEVKTPRDVQKTPKAMEQIFAGLHGVQTSVKFWDKYWKGKVPEWFSLEIAGIDGGVYFFVRTPAQFRNLVEAQIYAQYPDAEINETLDYAGPAAKKIPSKNFDMAGFELILARDDFYPIRTYYQFEEKEEEHRIDPLAAFLEILSKLKVGENIFIQYLVRPASRDDEDELKKTTKHQIDKMHGRKIEEKKNYLASFLDSLVEFLMNLAQGLFIDPIWSDKEEKSSGPAPVLSPGEKAVAEDIEKKLSKLLFKVVIRIVYIARTDVFNKANMAALLGAFKQFNTMNLNAFKPNSDAGTSANYPFFKTRREYLKKQNFMSRFVDRSWSSPSKEFILNAEEAATIYHYPVFIVEAPTLRRVESKKAEPPVSLPIG